MATCEHTCPLKPYVHIENHISSHATPIFMFTLATNANEITNAKIMKNKSSAYMEAHMSTQALCTHWELVQLKRNSLWAHWPQSKPTHTCKDLKPKHSSTHMWAHMSPQALYAH